MKPGFSKAGAGHACGGAQGVGRHTMPAAPQNVGSDSWIDLATNRPPMDVGHTQNGNAENPPRHQ